MAEQATSQTPILKNTSGISHLRNVMQEVLSTDLHVTGAHRETLREIAEEFRLAIDVQEVKQLRSERNELPVASPIRSISREVDGTPIAELGLTPSTLRKCQSQLVAYFDERVNRFTSVDQGIATIEELASIPLDQLRRQNYSTRAIRDIEKNLARAMGNRRSELGDDQESASTFPVLVDSIELISGFPFGYRHKVADSPATKAVLNEDIAFLPGITAESVAWLKRIPLQDTYSKEVRNLSTVADLVQMIVSFPDTWVGFDALQVNKYLLTYGLMLGINLSDEDRQKLEIKEVNPIVPAEGYTHPLIEMTNVFAMHR